MTPLSVSAKTSVTSAGSPTVAPRSPSSSEISSRRTWRWASIRTRASISSSAWTPFISMRAPSAMETFTSWRMVPSPRLTCPVERSSIPMRSAASRACSGERMSGPVPISTRGMPSRSSPHRTPSSVSPIRAADSSSSSMSVTETGPSLVSISPSVATSVDRWNPEVFDPSTTIFRMTCARSTTSMSSSLAISRVTSSASRSRRCGGSSSSSTRQVESNARYSNSRSTIDSSRAASSSSPSSLFVGWR